MSTTDCTAPSELAKNCTKSEMKLRNVTHLWAINNFDFCEAKKSTVISPEFSAFADDETIWKLQLNPSGNTESENTIGVFLMLSKKMKCESVFAKYRVFVLDEELKKAGPMWSSNIREFTPGSSWGIRKLCKKDENFRLKCLSNNVLKILFEVTYSTEKDIIEHHRYHDESDVLPTVADRHITKNLDMLFKTNLLADVVISVEGKDFPAHKAILAAQSKVFAVMLQHDSKEKEENRIEIKEMREEIVNEMLRFMYTGRCHNLDTLAGELLVAADRYDLDLLKTICGNALCENLSLENAAETLILADSHGADHLKTEAIKFIVKQPTLVFQTDSWDDMLSYPELIDEVCRAVGENSAKGDSNDSVQK